MFTELTKKLDSLLEMGVPFYDCIVLKDGKCVYRHADGYVDPQKTIKASGKETYNIYSCSKLITCVAALQLWEKGLFALDDKLSKYMPEFQNMTVKRGEEIVSAKNPIIIKDLFTMTAGFSYNLSSPQIMRCKEETNGECQTRELMRYLAKEPLLFEPGTKWEYSLCHDVLAALIEVLTGMTFGEYVKKNIFDPLEMNNSTFLLDDASLDRIANQYYYDPEKGVLKRDKHIDYKLGSKYESGGAGCISTVDDYVKFMEAIRVGDVILKRETVDLLATNQITKEQKQYFGRDPYTYALGQRCPMDDTTSDFGWGGAAGAHYAIDRKNGLSIYLGTHILGHLGEQAEKGSIVPIIQKILCKNAK